MNTKIFLTFFSFLLVLGASNINAAKGEYDYRERAVDVFESDDKFLKDTKVSAIINKIKNGDKSVLKVVVFDTLEAVHDEIVRRHKEAGNGVSYYDIIGGNNSVISFLGCLDNQSPTVRIKCLGFLSHWVDDSSDKSIFSKTFNLIKKELTSRLLSSIETRKDVRFAMRILSYKISRRQSIFKISKGNKRVLQSISPEEFLPMIYMEPRIRTLFLGASDSVTLQSVVLDRGIDPKTGMLVGSSSGRKSNVDLSKICYVGSKNSISNYGEVNQWVSEFEKDSQSKSKVNGVSGISSSRSFEVPSKSNLNWRCVQAVLSGLNNKSLFVRSNSARIFLNYVRGYTGDKNYLGNASGTSRVFKEELHAMSKNPYYVRMIQVAYENVKYSEYSYNDFLSDSTNMDSYRQMRYSLSYQNSDQNIRFYGKNGFVIGSYRPAVTKRYFTDDVVTFPEFATENTGSYINDLKEILRIFGNQWYTGAEYVNNSGVIGSYSGSNYVDSLFNDKDRPDRKSFPDSSDKLNGDAVTVKR